MQKHDEGIEQPGEKELLWFDTALAAINALVHYGAPFYLQLETFQHVESSGLQITISPGKNIVYLGCTMLTLGVFMLFYIQHRRFWIWFRPSAEGAEVLFAGTSLRPSTDFDREFARLDAGLRHSLSAQSG